MINIPSDFEGIVLDGIAEQLRAAAKDMCEDDQPTKVQHFHKCYALALVNTGDRVSITQAIIDTENLLIACPPETPQG